MATIDSCNAPESEACCASNTDTNYAKDMVKSDASIGYIKRACVLSNCTSNAPKSGDHSKAWLSTNDTHNTLETGEYTSDNTLKSDIPKTQETGECINDSVQKTVFIPPGTCCCLIPGVPTEQIAGDIFRIVTELTKATFTDKELNGNDLIQLNMEARSYRERGLFTNNMVSEIKKIVKQSYVQNINLEDYHQIIGVLSKFSSLENSAISINRNLDEAKKNETLKFLRENKLLTEEVILGIEELDEGKYDIQRKLYELQLINIPGIVESMNTLEELELMSDILVYKLTNIAKLVAVLTTTVSEQIKRIDKSTDDVDEIVIKYNEKKLDRPKIVVYINCRDDSSDLCEKEKQTKKENKQYKSRCHSEHNIPFCENCGWRNSWIKAFKKRGIYIKEVPSGSEKNVWVNNINKS